IFRPCHPDERPDQDVVDRLGEEEAEDECDAETEQRLYQARTQLDQMIEQWRLAGLDVFGSHDALASLSASGATSSVSCATGAGSASRTITNGSVAAVCVSASAKVSGSGASGVVGVTGG